jgi:hypothetical protein
VGRHSDFVVHPFAFTPRSHNARTTQICQMARDLGLALREDLNEVTDADLPAIHEVQQAQTSAVGESRKQ